MADDAEVESSSVRVMARCRPFNKREIAISERKKQKMRPAVRMRNNTCVVVEYFKDEGGFTQEREREAFEFDECFWSMPQQQCPENEKDFATQQYVYERSGKLAAQHAIQGFNVCIFAYGQTSSGKTHSMLGSEEDPGISPRLVDDLFARLAAMLKTSPACKMTVECMFFEIYNERVRDLFNKRSKQGEYDAPRIRQHPMRGVYVEGLERREVTAAADAKELISKGTSERAVAETKMNAHSSRSHAVFQLCVTQKDAMKGTQRISYINLVDLAGSEKLKQSEATGMTATEAKNINLSLSTLRRVIDILIENSQTKKQMVPPFRESVLTYVLSDSLGGNSKTQMIAAVSPHESNAEDTLGSLRYALRAKAIVCAAKVNEEKSAEMMDAMKDEIVKLRNMLRDGETIAGGATSGVVNEEIQRVLAEREAEVTKMEEEQRTMNEVVKHMEEELRKVDIAKQQLHVAVNEQKRDRFATAFRNAFLISREKKVVEQQTTELASLRKSVEVMTQRLEQYRKEEAALRVANETLHATIQEEQQSKGQRIVELTSDLMLLKESLHTLQHELDSTRDEKQALQTIHNAEQLRLHQLDKEVSSYLQIIDRERREKEEVRKAWMQSTAEQATLLEAAKKKKDKYKQLLVEEQLKLREIIETSRAQADREALCETIRAQQQLLTEKEFVCNSMARDLDSTRQKLSKMKAIADDREALVKALQQALEQHQQESLRWLADITQRDQELALLRKSHRDPVSRTTSPLMRGGSPLRTHPQAVRQFDDRSPVVRRPLSRVGPLSPQEL